MSAPIFRALYVARQPGDSRRPVICAHSGFSGGLALVFVHICGSMSVAAMWIESPLALPIASFLRESVAVVVAVVGEWAATTTVPSYGMVALIIIWVRSSMPLPVADDDDDDVMAGDVPTRPACIMYQHGELPSCARRTPLDGEGDDDDEVSSPVRSTSVSVTSKQDEKVRMRLIEGRQILGQE